MSGVRSRIANFEKKNEETRLSGSPSTSPKNKNTTVGNETLSFRRSARISNMAITSSTKEQAPRISPERSKAPAPIKTEALTKNDKEDAYIIMGTTQKSAPSPDRPASMTQQASLNRKNRLQAKLDEKITAPRPPPIKKPSSPSSPKEKLLARLSEKTSPKSSPEKQTPPKSKKSLPPHDDPNDPNSPSAINLRKLKEKTTFHQRLLGLADNHIEHKKREQNPHTFWNDTNEDIRTPTHSPTPPPDMIRRPVETRHYSPSPRRRRSQTLSPKQQQQSQPQNQHNHHQPLLAAANKSPMARMRASSQPPTSSASPAASRQRGRIRRPEPQILPLPRDNPEAVQNYFLAQSSSSSEFVSNSSKQSRRALQLKAEHRRLSAAEVDNAFSDHPLVFPPMSTATATTTGTTATTTNGGAPEEEDEDSNDAELGLQQPPSVQQHLRAKHAEAVRRRRQLSPRSASQQQPISPSQQPISPPLPEHPISPLDLSSPRSPQQKQLSPRSRQHPISPSHPNSQQQQQQQQQPLAPRSRQHPISPLHSNSPRSPQPEQQLSPRSPKQQQQQMSPRSLRRSRISPRSLQQPDLSSRSQYQQERSPRSSRNKKKQEQKQAAPPPPVGRRRDALDQAEEDDITLTSVRQIVETKQESSSLTESQKSGRGRESRREYHRRDDSYGLVDSDAYEEKKSESSRARNRTELVDSEAYEEKKIESPRALNRAGSSSDYETEGSRGGNSYEDPPHIGTAKDRARSSSDYETDGSRGGNSYEDPPHIGTAKDRARSSSDYETEGSRGGNSYEDPPHIGTAKDPQTYLSMSASAMTPEFFEYNKNEHEPQHARRPVAASGAMLHTKADDDETYDYGNRSFGETNYGGGDNDSHYSLSYEQRRIKQHRETKAREAAVAAAKQELGNGGGGAFMRKDDVEHYRKTVDTPFNRTAVGVAAASTLGCILMGPVGLLVGAAAVGIGVGYMEIPEAQRKNINSKTAEALNSAQEGVMSASEKLSNTCATSYRDSGISDHVPVEIQNCCTDLGVGGMHGGDDLPADDENDASVVAMEDNLQTRTSRDWAAHGPKMGDAAVRKQAGRLTTPAAHFPMGRHREKNGGKVACLRKGRIVPVAQIHSLDPALQARAWIDVLASADTTIDEKIEAMEEVLILGKDKVRARLFVEEGILDSIMWTIDRYFEKTRRGPGWENWANPVISKDDARAAKLAANCCLTLGKSYCAAIHTEGDLLLMSLYERGTVPEERQLAQMLHEVPHHTRATKTDDPTIVTPGQEIFALKQLTLPQAEELAASIYGLAMGQQEV